MNEQRPPNTGFASGGVTCKLGALCFVSSSVQVDSFVLRKPARTQSPKTLAVIVKNNYEHIHIWKWEH